MNTTATASDGSRRRKTRTGGGPGSLRAAKEELTRTHVIEAAERIFAEHGYNQARMQDIAGQAGMSLATLYQVFPGKQQLYRAVLLERDQAMMQAVMNHPALAAGTALTVRGLLGIMQGQLGFLLAHPDYLRMILQQGHAWYHVAAQPTADEQALWDQGLKLMTRIFEHGMRTGELLPAAPEEQSRLLMALQQARLAGWVAGGMTESHDAVIARIQADFVRQFCRPALQRELLDDEAIALRPQCLAATGAAAPETASPT